MGKPTKDGLGRYPTTAGYNLDSLTPVACVCTSICPRPCAGECGCEACTQQFQTFCAIAGDAKAASKEALLAAYRTSICR